jgi:hypothetical protein
MAFRGRDGVPRLESREEPKKEGSGAKPRGRMRSAFCSLPKISGSENGCPNLGSSSWSPGQLSDLELMLLNLLRKLNSGDRHSSSIESLESEHGTNANGPLVPA